MNKNYLRLLIFPFVLIWSLTTTDLLELNIKNEKKETIKVYAKQDVVGELMSNLEINYDLLDGFERTSVINEDADAISLNEVEYGMETVTQSTPYTSKTIYTTSVPLWTTKVIQEGISQGKTHYYRVQYINGVAVNREFVETVVSSTQQNEIIGIGLGNPGTFYGSMTGYGPDCVGCSGNVACRPGQNVQNGNIYFRDGDYGKIRIIAADKQVPCGTVMKITGYGKPITAVVMDRGGAIQGKKVDLLFASEAETNGIGRQNNIRFDVLRWGW